MKKRYPQLKIDFVIRSEYKSSVELNPNINKVITISRDYNIKDIRKQLAQNNYDVIVDLQNNFRSKLLSKGISSNIFRYKKPYFNRFLLVNFNINRFSEIIPIPKRYSRAIPNFELDKEGLELIIPETLNSSLSESKNYIGFCPGSRHKTKMWPAEYFIELGNKLTENNYKVVLLGGKDDKQICKEISDNINGSIDLSNNDNLFELAVNIKKCKTVICNDSGLMHASIAVGTSVIAIFGSTVKELGFFPYGGENLVLENNSLSCRPCSHIGLDECPKKHLKCMKDITPSFVLKETLQFIDKL